MFCMTSKRAQVQNFKTSECHLSQNADSVVLIGSPPTPAPPIGLDTNYRQVAGLIESRRPLPVGEFGGKESPDDICSLAWRLFASSATADLYSVGCRSSHLSFVLVVYFLVSLFVGYSHSPFLGIKA